MHRRFITTTALALLLGATVAGCANRPTADGRVAVAPLLLASGERAGRATLTPVLGGVEIAIEVSGLKPGPHGFHIHANGACAPGPDGASGEVVDFGAAGGHFDPGASANHGRPGEPVHAAHAGELPNIEVGPDGRGRLRYVNPNVRLADGPLSVVGRSLVVHADADDYATDPAGNAGTRLLCGVIALERGDR